MPIGSRIHSITTYDRPGDIPPKSEVLWRVGRNLELTRAGADRLRLWLKETSGPFCSATSLCLAKVSFRMEYADVFGQKQSVEWFNWFNGLEGQSGAKITVLK
jgi:hypothetical protein